MINLLESLKRALYNLRSKLWYRPLSYSLIAILWVYLCFLLQELDVNIHSTKINIETVNSLLSIITGSMLAVIVFTVGSIVTAYNSASNSGTPRILSLLLRDNTSHDATSCFIGTFIYGVVATVAIKSGIFDETGIFLIFLITIAVFAWVIFTFIVWIDSIAKLGQVKTLMNKTESQALNAIQKYISDPYLGCNRLEKNKLPNNTKIIYANEYGYLNGINIEGLNAYCKNANIKLYITKHKGEHLACSEVLAHAKASKTLSDEQLSDIASYFTISTEKSFLDDPVFGVETLSEIAAKALSPSTNDPGTAIHVIDAINRCLKKIFTESSQDHQINYEQLYLREISIERFIKSSFEYIRVYGGGNIMVAKRIQKSLIHISKHLNGQNKKVVLAYAKSCQKQADDQLTYDFERKEFNDIVKELSKFES
ncbi:DUF2254 domain-containing protein [Francisella adeliensis]|uniref:DUF2254 domain-containing protein n=1 Tax=Francisella adeliensis TaxID=2007306 RepID=A0A2Z4XZH3_9GAMM|nr:DUF2254 domain-containing protein [Francisella adeliensis]AXA34277.1 hypothetical protein CDH04_07600 [Francisella adeliensis]MBK2084918.1 DUF2254 domain-containing protein [Francisella adeliensis]MBK2096251.1 DUF2254 domain-containing protein [Francisella adeliensis]QIW12521.1 DUF2254 domain-containing protein [Francisella adeliensis]QIW14394.1 DUF2254 domain-containing protein [Francisella adeliensis]